MPFSKVKKNGKTMYKSPSGKLYTPQQMKAYYAGKRKPRKKSTK